MPDTRTESQRAYEARQALRKAATDYAASILLGDASVTAAAFERLENVAEGYKKEKK